MDDQLVLNPAMEARVPGILRCIIPEFVWGWLARGTALDLCIRYPDFGRFASEPGMGVVYNTPCRI